MKLVYGVSLGMLVAILGCGDGRAPGGGKKGGIEGTRVGELEVVSATESRKRTEVLPATPTEDASGVLGRIEVAAPVKAGKKDYLPEVETDWVLDVRVAGEPQLDVGKIEEAFEAEWYKAVGGCSIYGRDVRDQRWTYLIAKDGPQAVDQLKFAFDLVEVTEPDAPLADEAVYQQRLQSVTERMQRIGQATVTASLSPGEAVKRSVELLALRRECDVSAVIRLQAPSGKRFDGRQVWDVMLCLGLHWGDMDCFHWKNPSDVGDDYFFSVETSTAPGYFLPEKIAAGEVHVEDLVFVFSVPRSARPVEVFDAMQRAAEYCRKRLGGTVEVGKVEREKIEGIVGRLRGSGFTPGTDAALRLF